MREQMHQIGEVAARVGLSLRTVRYYEEVGVVVPSGRTEGGFRLYTDEDIDLLALVKQLKPLDFSLDEMRDLLEVRAQLANPRTGSRRRAELTDRLAMYASAAQERCDALREQLEAVEELSAKLRSEARSSTTSRSRR